MNIKNAWPMLKTTASEWSDDNASRLAAALAYYTALSISPLLIIAIAIAGLLFGREAVRGEVVEQIQGMVGQQGAQAIQSMIESAAKPSSGIAATVVGVVTLIFGATGVFAELQSSLDTIWDVTPKKGRGIFGLIKDRFLSLAMVMGIGFLLMVSLVLSAGVSAMGSILGDRLPGMTFGVHVATLVGSFGVTMLLFAMIYKVLPDVKIAWGDVWIGAAATALMFTLGKFLIGLYLGKTSAASAYGAAGSVIVVLIWVYYSAQILFFGAEFTQVYAKTHGSRLTPTGDAVALNKPGDKKDDPRASSPAAGAVPKPATGPRTM